MWIIITGVILSSPLILFYLVNDSSEIFFDKKNCRIIILHKSPPTIIKFDNLIKVDLVINGKKATITDIRSKQHLIKNTDSVWLEIISTDIDKPVHVNFVNNPKKKTDFENNDAGKRAAALYNKLANVIDSSDRSRSKNIRRNTATKYQFNNLVNLEVAS